MKILISYFYQVRNMKPYMFPLSTAKWDPQWYHDNKSPSYTFWDKNGVLNGLRAEIFAPNSECSQYCGQCDNKKQPCLFLQKYKQQLNHNSFYELLLRFEKLWETLRQDVDIGTHEPIFILLVHEAPNNPCSERGPLIQYFNEHGVKLEEFDPNKEY